MDQSPEPLQFANVVLVNDNRTPHDFVVQSLRLIFGKSEREARQIAADAGWLGRAGCGCYPMAVAEAFMAQAARYSTAASHGLAYELEPLRASNGEAASTCSFCGKSSDEVRTLLAGKDAFICDGCVVSSATTLASDVSGPQFNFVYELLERHFAGCSKEQIVSSARSFPERMRADLQRAAEALFAAQALRTIAIHGGYDYEQTTIATLLHQDRNARTIGPLRYQDVDVGSDEPVKCLENAVWLLRTDDTPHAVILVRQRDMRGFAHINIEIAAPAGEKGQQLIDRYFRSLEQAVTQAASYRGKVLSLEQMDMYSGMAGGILVHRLPPVEREAVILPEHTLRLLERNIIQFARQRQTLRRLGQSSKKGLLFHGPPGTGKTHTVRYLASALGGHTTLLVTSEQVGLLPEYFTLARLLQPSIIVIEDADLIARDRDAMQSTCEEVLLNKLLNEMDGLRQDAEIFFILTTNRPQMLEEALAARPGRIDQAIEFPLPDANGRRKLVALYGQGLEITAPVLDALVAKTEGVSAAFIKELMRRSAQYCLERNDAGRISLDDTASALEEMLFNAGRLNRALLGADGTVAKSAAPQ